MELLSTVYWYPALYHSNILELLYKKMGTDKFMQAAEIFFAFPEKMELHESSSLVLVIETLTEKDERAEKIIRFLVSKNPSKYWDRGKKLKKKRG